MAQGIKSENPLVSILIPVYNRAETIVETVNSALTQTYQETEIILVDNKSTDATFEVLKENFHQNPKVKLWQNETNLGPVLNWKACLERAEGEYIKFLWSDDFIAPTFLEKTIPLFDEEVGFVLTPRILQNQHGKYIEKSRDIVPTGKYDLQSYFDWVFLKKYDFPVSPGASILRKKDAELNLNIDISQKYGIQSRNTGAGVDLLLMINSFQRYPKFAFLNDFVSIFVSHDGSISQIEGKINLWIQYEIPRIGFTSKMGKKLKKGSIDKYYSTLNLVKKRFHKTKFQVPGLTELFKEHGMHPNFKPFFALGKSFRFLLKRLLKKIT